MNDTVAAPSNERAWRLEGKYIVEPIEGAHGEFREIARFQSEGLAEYFFDLHRAPRKSVPVALNDDRLERFIIGLFGLQGPIVGAIGKMQEVEQWRYDIIRALVASDLYRGELPETPKDRVERYAMLMFETVRANLTEIELSKRDDIKWTDDTEEAVIGREMFRAMARSVLAAFDRESATGWIVSNGDEDKFRFWDQVFGPSWTTDRSKALRFARREDAEAFAAEDEDAWKILPAGER